MRRVRSKPSGRGTPCVQHPLTPKRDRLLKRGEFWGIFYVVYFAGGGRALPLSPSLPFSSGFFAVGGFVGWVLGWVDVFCQKKINAPKGALREIGSVDSLLVKMDVHCHSQKKNHQPTPEMCLPLAVKALPCMRVYTRSRNKIGEVQRRRASPVLTLQRPTWSTYLRPPPAPLPSCPLFYLWATTAVA